MTLQAKLEAIISDPNLSVKQKTHYLALEADASLPYLALPDGVQEALHPGKG